MNWNDSGHFIKSVFSHMRLTLCSAETGWKATSDKKGWKIGRSKTLTATEGIHINIGGLGYLRAQGTLSALLNFLNSPEANKMLWKNVELDHLSFTAEEMRERLQPTMLYCEITDQHERNSVYRFVNSTAIRTSISMANESLTVIQGPTYAVYTLLTGWTHPQTKFYARGSTNPQSAAAVLSQLRMEGLSTKKLSDLKFRRWWMEQAYTHRDIDHDHECCLASESDGCESCVNWPE